MARLLILNEFKKIYSAKEWCWGKVDCSLVLADWSIFLGYNDSASHLRGTYSTEEELKSIIESKSGLVNLVESCTKKLNLLSVERFIVGDIAVIGSRYDVHKQWGAIYDGTNWNVRLQDDGFVPFVAPILKGWRL